MNRTTTLISLLALISGAALAADAPPCGAGAPGHFAERFNERFDKADTDHDGKLTLAEAQAGMPRLAKLFDQIDVKKQGYLTRDDIRTFMISHRPHAPRGDRGAPFNERFNEHFDKADADHDGKLTLAEALAGMPRLAKDFDAIDVKKQGYLTRDDLRAWREGHHRGPRCADQSQPS